MDAIRGSWLLPSVDSGTYQSSFSDESRSLDTGIVCEEQKMVA